MFAEVHASRFGVVHSASFVMMIETKNTTSVDVAVSPIRKPMVYAKPPANAWPKLPSIPRITNTTIAALCRRVGNVPMSAMRADRTKRSPPMVIQGAIGELVMGWCPLFREVPDMSMPCRECHIFRHFVKASSHSRRRSPVDTLRKRGGHGGDGIGGRVVLVDVIN